MRAWSHVAASKRLRGLDLPDAYLRLFHRARLVRYDGLGLFVILLAVALRARG